MGKVEIKLIRDDKKEFVIDGVLWGIPSDDGLKGFDSVDFDARYTDLAYGDGGIEENGRVGVKDRTIKAILRNPALSETQRHVVQSFFNPKHHFKLYITYMGVQRWCEGRLAGFQQSTKNIYKRLQIMFTLRSTMPYLQSVDDFGKDINSSIPLACFPYQSRVNYPWGCGVTRFAQFVELENDGDVETFFRCVIVANGTVKNPKLLKDDKYIRILDTLQRGDVYEIDFVKKPLTVKKNGANAIGKTDRTSNFLDMLLDVGASKISFDAEQGANDMSVTLYYNKRYTGV